MSDWARQDPELGHHRVDLGLGRGPQRHQLGPVPDELSQLAHLGRGDPRLGQVIAAQPVGQLGGVLDVVLDPPAVPVQTERVDQMHPAPLGLEQIGRPVPAIARLQGHLRVRARLGDRHRPRDRVVVDLGHAQHLAGVVHPHDHRPAAMQVDPDILLLLHAKSFLARGFWFRTPECCPARTLRREGLRRARQRILGQRSRLHFNRRRQRSHRRSAEARHALLHDIKYVRVAKPGPRFKRRPYLPIPALVARLEGSPFA